MSLRVDDRSSRRDRSRTRDRSRSNVRAESPPYDRPSPGYEIRSPDQYTPYPEDRYEGRALRDEDRSRDEPRRRRNTKDESSDEELAYGAPRHDERQYSSSIIRPDERQSRNDYRYSAEQAKDDYRYPLRSDDRDYKVLAPQDVKYASNNLTYTAKPHDERSEVRRQSSYDRPEVRRQSTLERQQDTQHESRRQPPLDRQSDTQYEARRRSTLDRQPETQYEVRRQSTLDTDRRQTTLDDRQSDRRQSTLDTGRYETRDITPRDTRTSNSLVPAGLGVHRMSISGGLPPPSPLLEAYHGTYQSISPMPTAMRLEDDDIPSLDFSRHSKIEKKKVKLYDPESDAKTLAKALSSSSVDSETICDILPPLSDDQIWELRKEYKKQVKIQGKGINLSKHLKMKLSGNFGKVVYVTALGRWESEGYWANFFYQSHGSRRELLIESLMGRTNAEIRSIKDEFKDKRYNDDLIRCMEKELKMDKFRAAILMSLEGRRQEEQDVYPQEYRDRDVDMLQRAVRSSGGESAMLEIVVRRSDNHLKEILRQYEKMYGENFARVALKKSNNLVGEVMAHILNGVINKPARDALLIRHAIKDIAAHNKDDELRYELLISRLVRLHWDRLHLMRVKKEYKEKYGKYLEEDLEDSTKGDFRDFICELCDVQGPR